MFRKFKNVFRTVAIFWQLGWWIIVLCILLCTVLSLRLIGYVPGLSPVRKASTEIFNLYIKRPLNA